MTMRCALSHWSLPAHHSATSAGASPTGGFGFARQARNWVSVIIVESRCFRLRIDANRSTAAQLPPALRREMTGGLFHHLGEREQRLLVEGAADKLESQWQALPRKARRHGDARQPSQVHGNREHVIEVHLHGIATAFL